MRTILLLGYFRVACKKPICSADFMPYWAIKLKTVSDCFFENVVSELIHQFMRAFSNEKTEFYALVYCRNSHDRLIFTSIRTNLNEIEICHIYFVYLKEIFDFS